jgi:hypothetical protein
MPVKMTVSQFKRLQKRIVPTGMSRSDLMTFHLLLVEAVRGGKLPTDELRSPRFTESREVFVRNMLAWANSPERK